MRLRRWFGSIFALSFLGLMLGLIWSMTGCGEIAPSWFGEPTPEPTPTVQPTPTATPTPTPTATPVRRPRRYGKGKAKKTQPATAAEKITPVSEVSPTPEVAATSNALMLEPAVSTADRAAQRRHGLQLIDEASTKIDGIDRDKLKARDADDYDRVRSFIRDALEHMKQEDYLAAESLAQKASLLATELMSRVSVPAP